MRDPPGGSARSGFEDGQRLFYRLALGEGDLDPTVGLTMLGCVIGIAGLGICDPWAMTRVASSLGLVSNVCTMEAERNTDSSQLLR